MKFKNRNGEFDECSTCVACHIYESNINPCDVSVRRSRCPHYLDFQYVKSIILTCLYEEDYIRDCLDALYKN